MRALVIIIGFLSMAAMATDLSHIYDTEFLEYWRNRYEPSLRGNFEDLVIGSLTHQERKQLGPVRLSLPLRAAGDLAGDPLLYYAAPGQVVFPIQSVKFFDDLSLGWAYAWAHALPLENVTDYVAALKYQQLPAEGFAPPLAALGVATDAWKIDVKVDDVSQKILKSAMVWLMAHEVAHILYQHPGYGPGVTAAQAQAAEAQADRFANTIMRRIGVVPSGMVNFFMMMAHWSPNRGDFASDEAWQDYLQEKATHPFTAKRMHALADDLEHSPADFIKEDKDSAEGIASVSYIAEQLRSIARILDDSDVQRAIAAKARATDLAKLNYTRPAAVSDSAALAFDGRYDGRFLHRLPDGSVEELDLNLEMRRHGHRVQGSFDFGLGPGRLEGLVQGKDLVFQWAWGANFGLGRLSTEGEDGLAGELGYNFTSEGAGSWHLRRKSG